MENEDGLNHGTAVLKLLVFPWVQMDCCICADSYFASVNAVEEMTQMGLQFIGVVKTATKKFPMTYLSNLELSNRGDFRGLVARGADGHPEMIAFVWMDQDRQYFISNASSLLLGDPYVRKWWRQVNPEENAEPEQVELTIPQPKAAQIYYSTCGKIDNHNQCRQDTLNLEKKLKTHSWHMRVNLSILAMVIVDTWLVYSKCTKLDDCQTDFYIKLSEELIDNNYEEVARRRRRIREEEHGSDNDSVNDDLPVLSRTGHVRAGVHIHLTPTKRMRKKKDGSVMTDRLQGRCMICQKKTTYLCSECIDVDNECGKTPWLCHTKHGQECFACHYDFVHASINA